MTYKCPVDHGQHSANSCPVEQGTRSTWSSLFSNKGTSQSDQFSLSVDREVSSIPRTSDAHWVYPSEAQFFAAMARKNHNPQASDMKTIVPIHNAVNERAWAEVLRWEAGRGGDKCGGVKLVTFKGRPNDLSPKARLMTFLGYSPPFDRHDWVVDRCGTKIRYVIDFYTGRATSSSGVSFYLDVRPALDDWEGVKMRLEGAFGGLFGPTARESGIAPPSRVSPSTST